MIKVGVNHSRLYIRGKIPLHDLRKLDRLTSYKVKGYYFSQAYREGRWDGKIHLLKINKSGASLPIGLHDVAFEFLKGHGYDFDLVDKRVDPRREIVVGKWPREFEAREYQSDAVDSLFESGLAYLHGTVRSPVRSGKTIMQARVVHRVGCRAVVLVGSKAALDQTRNTFAKVFGESTIGVLGDGHKSTNDITIASVQAVLADPKAASAAFDGASLLIIDEFHHYTKSGGRNAQSWKDIVLDLAIPYKVGFSGTIYFDEKDGTPEEDIWLRAIAGPIVYSISMRSLIDLGYLVEPEIYFVTFKETLDAPNYQAAYKELLAHPRRNGKIVNIAEAASRSNHRTIIVTNRIEQAKILGELLAARGVRHEVLTGPDDMDKRKAAFAEFCGESSLRVLVGTVFNETVDLPPADVVINASGGMSRGGTIQKLRNLTAYNGKSRAIVFDVADIAHKDFRRHARERKNHYRAEGLSCRLLNAPVEGVL